MEFLRRLFGLQRQVTEDICLLQQDQLLDQFSSVLVNKHLGGEASLEEPRLPRSTEVLFFFEEAVIYER